MVTDDLLKKCHADINGCEIAWSADKKKCIGSCNSQNREWIVAKECTICNEYYSADEQSCNKTCAEG